MRKVVVVYYRAKVTKGISDITIVYTTLLQQVLCIGINICLG